VYNLGLDEFIAWFQQEARPAGFTKATVTAWRVALEARNSARSRSTCGSRRYGNWRSRRQTKDCSRRNWRRGLLRIKGVRSHGVRAGNWLSLRQAQALLNAPDVRTKKGLRDRAMFATLLGCGLRRSELANLTMKHVQQRDNRWCIVDLVGKHGRVPTIPMPAWVKNAIDAWTAEAAVADGHLFRPVNRGDQVRGMRMSEKVVWQILKTYVAAAGLPDIAPHDLRRTTAKLCRAAGGELEQIQMLLGHSSVQTTERYLGTKQDLAHAPNDAIKLTVAV
jgi:site-specific recombinase XerD